MRKLPVRGRRYPRLLAVLVVATALVAPGVVASPATATAQRQHHDAGPLDILLTNDDGFEAPTLHALADALTGAGHDVTVVAPCTDQSGRGTAEAANYHTHGPKAGHTITARQVSEDTWKVCGTPADSVLFGAQHAFGGGEPDLVVSGINPGQNIGAVANHSGTVGATITALELGIPAIAVSAAYDLDTRPAKLASIPDTADFAVRLIHQLQLRGRHGRLLPEHVALNVNYPAVESPAGPELTQQGSAAFVSPGFVPAEDVCADCYLVTTDTSGDAETVPNADTTAIAQGKISITPLDGYWTADRRTAGQLRGVLRGLSP